MRKAVRWPLLVGALLALWVGLRGTDDSASAQSGNILKNPGFEDRGDGVPNWTIEQQTAGQGQIAVSTDQKANGNASLLLAPNNRNRANGQGAGPLRVAQGFPGGGFRNKTLHLSAWMKADGGATAIFSAVVLRRSGGAALVELKRESGQQAGVLTDVLQIPDAGDIALLIVGCSVEGNSGSAYFDDVYAGTDPPPTTVADTGNRTTSTTSSRGGAAISVDFARDVRPIPRELYGANLEWVWDGNGLIDPEKNAPRPQIMDLIRDLRPSLLRFPGGIFANHYHWKDGTGPIQSRREASHILGDPKSRMLLGTDEALATARAAGGRLLITANISTASPEEAAEWVRYVNRDSSQRVDYWELGNELYIRDGSPPSKLTGLTPSQYADRFLRYAKAMRAADPKIKLGAITDDNYGRSIPHADKDWTGDVLKRIGDQADFLSLHNGYAPMLARDPGGDVKAVYAAMLAAPVLISGHLDRVSSRIDRELPKSRDIEFAITEWGPLFQGGTKDRYVDHVKTLGSGLYVASTMNAFLRSKRTTVATIFKLIDPLFAGIIGQKDQDFRATAPYYALQLYTRRFGDVLLDTQAQSPAYNSRSIGWVDAVQGVPYLDAVASRSNDKRRLILVVVNKHFSDDLDTEVSLKGFRPRSQANVWTLSGRDVDANTGTRPLAVPGIQWGQQAEVGRFRNGAPDEVWVKQTSTKASEQFRYTFPRHSVTLIEFVR